MIRRRTDAVASDNEPVITLGKVAPADEHFTLTGTAAVWEGTLHVDWVDGSITYVDVSAGAPERGSWSLVVPRAAASRIRGIHPMFEGETDERWRRSMTLDWPTGITSGPE